jgi:hypothetical protein
LKKIEILQEQDKVIDTVCALKNFMDFDNLTNIWAIWFLFIQILDVKEVLRKRRETMDFDELANSGI